MCLMCHKVLTDLLDREGNQVKSLNDGIEREKLRTELLKTLHESRVAMVEAGVEEETDDDVQPCLECESKDSVDEWGFFCGRECMDTFDNRVREELAHEHRAKKRSMPPLPRMSDFLTDCFKSVNPKYYV
jgi:hypothetical protein